MAKGEIVRQTTTTSVKEKGQYAVAFSLVGVMLYVAGFPILFLLFIGALSYFIWKVFSSESRSDVRRIFEFYLSANEILREDHRRWYGFEIQETISRGEKIVRSMAYSPPLVHFALGSLYERLGDLSSAVRHLTYIEHGSESETGIVFPSSEFREYVRILRKIERSPAEAPQTSSAIRSLERARKSKTSILLASCRDRLAEEQANGKSENHQSKSLLEAAPSSNGVSPMEEPGERRLPFGDTTIAGPRSNDNDQTASDTSSEHGKRPERKTISEVLHDIYDGSVQ